MHNTIGVISAKKEERNTININKEWNPSIKSARQKKTQVNTTQRKKNIRERPYAKRTHNYEMTINDNKEDIKQKSCHLSSAKRDRSFGSQQHQPSKPQQ